MENQKIKCGVCGLEKNSDFMGVQLKCEGPDKIHPLEKDGKPVLTCLVCSLERFSARTERQNVYRIL